MYLFCNIFLFASFSYLFTPIDVFIIFVTMTAQYFKYCNVKVESGAKITHTNLRPTLQFT